MKWNPKSWWLSKFVSTSCLICIVFNEKTTLWDISGVKKTWNPFDTAMGEQYTGKHWTDAHLWPGSRWRAGGSSSRSWRDCRRKSAMAGRADCRPVYTHITPSLLPTHRPWLQTQHIHGLNVTKHWFFFLPQGGEAQEFPALWVQC